MRKLIALFPLLLAFSCGQAQPVTSPSSFDAMRKEAYSAGYRIGYEKGEIDGYGQKMSTVLSSLYEWERDRTARAVGNYLLSNGVIEKPEFFFARDGKTAKIDVKGMSVNLSKAGVLLTVYAPPPPDCGNFIPYPQIPEKPKVPECSYDNPIQQIACVQGEKKGYSDGLKKGMQDADRDVFAVLSRYRLDLMQVENGKYAEDSTTMSAPAVFFCSGNVSVEPPIYEQPLTLREIASFVPYSKREENAQEEFNGVELPKTPAVLPLVSPSDRQPQPVDVKINSTPDSLAVLMREGIPYEVKDGEIYARFFSPESAEKFCLKYPHLCEKQKGEKKNGSKKADRR
jgi:hypothetical protein